MNVVINPTGGKAGHSFKGLHAYCAHDQGSAQTSERVDWIETRNIGTDDPAQAWKVMVATAQAKDSLKRAAGIRAGRPEKSGPVMHVVLCFDKDEPSDHEAMTAAADEFLSRLGVDPAKMRGKNKPKTRQFADEHQVIMYAHRDTDHHHLHLMINRVHPQTGVNLPSNNDYNKASDWALDYSKRHGTDHKTPARAENKVARQKGDYVKAKRRKSRNVYEQEKALEQASNDNEAVQSLLDQQRKKDAALSLKGRNMKALQAREWNQLIKTHQERKAAIGRYLQTEINKAKAAVREEYRPAWRSLAERQQKERQTFEGLEKSFFGRAGNIFKTVKLSANLIRQDKTGIITRTFRILTNAGERKAYFDKAQERARRALGKEQAQKLDSIIQAKKRVHAERMESNRAVFKVERQDIADQHAAKVAQFRQDWKERTAERKTAFEKMAQLAKLQKIDLSAQQKNATTYLDHEALKILERYKYREEFEKSRDGFEQTQDNEKHNDDEQER